MYRTSGTHAQAQTKTWPETHRRGWQIKRGTPPPDAATTLKVWGGGKGKMMKDNWSLKPVKRRGWPLNRLKSTHYLNGAWERTVFISTNPY